MVLIVLTKMDEVSKDDARGMLETIVKALEPTLEAAIGEGVLTHLSKDGDVFLASAKDLVSYLAKIFK